MKAFYFPHDDNAAGDERVLKLRVKFGNTEGYAMWFMLLEYLARNHGKMTTDAIQELYICYSIPAEKWKDFIDECGRIGLLQENQHVKFSPRLISHLKERENKKTLAQKAANTRWGSQKPAYAYADAPAYADAMPGEERRGEERILKKPTKKALKNDDEIISEFFNLANKQGWTSPDYEEKSKVQLSQLAPDEFATCLSKMRVAINASYSYSDSTRKLAKKIYFEVVGRINDFGAMQQGLNSKELASRRELPNDDEF